MLRRIIRILAIGLAVTVVFAAGLLLYLRNADLSLYHEQVETFLSNRIGHELKIDGRFELSFGTTTVLTAENVSLTNTNWAGNAELIRVGYLEFAFDTWSLFSEPFIVVKLGARDVQGSVIQDESGATNWASERRKTEASGPTNFDINRIAFQNVSIEKVEFGYENPARSRPLRATIERLEVSPDEQGILDIETVGTLNDLLLRVDGQAGPWQNFVDGKNIFADLDLVLGALTVELDGTIADIVRLEGLEMDGNLHGSDIGGVLSRLDLPLFADGVFTLNSRIHQRADGHALEVTGNFGEIQIQAEGNVDSLLIPRRSSMDVRIEGPDAGKVANLFGIEGLPPASFEIEGSARRDGWLVELDDVLLRVGQNALRVGGSVDIAAVNLDLEFEARGPDFSVLGLLVATEGLPEEAFDISGRVIRSGNAWEAQAVDATVGSNRLRANGRVKEGGANRAQIAIRAEGPDIAFVERFLDIEGIPSGPYDIDVLLRSHADGIEVAEGVGLFGENRIEASGVLVLEAGLEGTRGFVRATGPEFHNVALISGVPYLPAGPFALQGGVRLESSSVVMDQVKATVGELDGTADGWVGLGEKGGEFELEIDLQGPDVGALPGVEWPDSLAGEAFGVSGAIARSGFVTNARGLNLSIANLNARLNGRMSSDEVRLEASVVADAADATFLRKLTALDNLPEGAVAASGSFSLEADSLNLSNASLMIGDYRVEADGMLHLRPLRNDSNLAFTFNGPSLQEAARTFGFGGFPHKEFQIAGQFNGTPTGLEIQDLAAKIGGNDVTGEFSANLKEKPIVVGSLSSSFLDISDGLTRAGAAESRPETGDGEDRPRLFSDAPLDTSWLQKANIDVEFKVGELIAKSLHVSDVDIGLTLRDGSLSIDPIFLRDGVGKIEASFSLMPEDGQYRMKSSGEIVGLHFGLLAGENQDSSTLPRMDGKFRIEGLGDSVRAIMGTANGYLSLVQGPGQIKELFGFGIFKDVGLEALRLLNPQRERGFQQVECGFYDATITDGVLVFDRIAIQTKGVTTVASGRVKLRSERIDMTFRAKPREGLGVSLGTVANAFLSVGGTLKQPTVSVDPGRSAATAGVAVATGGWSLIARGLWDRVSAEANICSDRRR